jgi:hypothetical protein
MYLYLFISQEININKHLKKLLQGTVLPIALIKYEQQEADPLNKKKSLSVLTV